jgi:hypothetical protein
MLQGSRAHPTLLWSPIYAALPLFVVTGKATMHADANPLKSSSYWAAMLQNPVLMHYSAGSGAQPGTSQTHLSYEDSSIQQRYLIPVSSYLCRHLSRRVPWPALHFPAAVFVMAEQVLVRFKRMQLPDCCQQQLLLR